jgi:hypothetical protein
MEDKLLQLFKSLEIFDPFDFKVLLLQKNIQLEVIKVIKPFLELMKLFDAQQAYNMVAIMLDLYFKLLCVVKNLVGCGNKIQMKSKYGIRLLFLFEWFALIS